ncbi:MAG: DMT family transporter [Anaerolineaceae bacterium]|nr:DMT family transporter [Anaerolineaceae bacterium]
MNNHRNQGIQYGITSALFLGIIPILGKQSINLGFQPLAVVAFRTTLATIFIMLFISLIRKGSFYIYPIGLIGCLLAGLINGIGSILYYTALSRMNASIAHLLYSFYPLFIALLQFLDKQRLSKVTAIRLVLTLPGVYLLVGTATNTIDPIGLLLMLASAFLYALHLIINQRILYEVPAPTVTLYTLIAMSVTVCLSFVIFSPHLPAHGTSYWPLIAMALATLISRVTLFMGVKNLGSLQTALLGFSEQFVTVFLAITFLQERLSLLQWLGASLIGISLLLVAFEKQSTNTRRKSGLLSWLDPQSTLSMNFPWKSPP